MAAGIRELDGPDTALAFPAMAELRPRLVSVDAFCDEVARQRPHGYRLVAAFAEGEADAVAVAGFRIGHTFSWGEHLYLDDLVTREAHRRCGHGRRLLEWVRDEARRHGCEQLHLDSGVQRFAAHRLYLSFGFDITSHHFAIRRL